MVQRVDAEGRDLQQKTCIYFTILDFHMYLDLFLIVTIVVK